MKVDWKKVWDDFDEWLEKKERPIKCSKCHHHDYNTPEWEEQQTKIKKLVNAQLKDQIQALITKGAKTS